MTAALVLSPEAPCTLCAILARGVADDGRRRWCHECGAWVERRGDTSPEVPPSRKRTLPHALVPAFVRAVLRMAAQRELADAPVSRIFVDASGGRSPVCSVLDQLALGAIGDGCSGTKGVWRGDRGEPLEILPPRQVLTPEQLEEHERRYAGLDARARAVADAVIEDGKGDGLVDVDLGAKTPVALTLAQRVALIVGPPVDVARWKKHAKVRDTGPLQQGGGEVGEERLREAARGWWGA